ncbi:MAG TPA: response regulator transcription factor [Chloroflexia bacterium]|nr:response regulator transcription factor [Chloroflexia bacterium]
MAITLIIVDDQPSIRHAVKECLSFEHEVTVVGEASDGAEALALARDLRPDVVLTDIKMANMDGFGVAEGVRRALPGTRVVILSVYDTAANRERARKAGAAFISKHEPAEALLAAIIGESSLEKA